MASSPTTVASTANISTLTEQMMMLEIDDIDETNCAPDSASHSAADMNMFANGSQLDENSIYSQEQALNLTKEEQMQRLMMQHFFTN